jgi:hypothetical protein
MSLKLAVGDLTIHRIVGQETTFLPGLDILAVDGEDTSRGQLAYLRGSGVTPAS